MEIGLGEERPRERDDETGEERAATRETGTRSIADRDRGEEADIFGASDCNCATPGRGPGLSLPPWLHLIFFYCKKKITNVKKLTFKK
jgi:hypothetical protein